MDNFVPAENAKMQYVCRLGGLSERPQFKHSPHECMCPASCEPHIHDFEDILCLHDGENDHSHCPNIKLIDKVVRERKLNQVERKAND